MRCAVIRRVAVAAVAVIGTAGWITVAGVGNVAAQRIAIGTSTRMPQPGIGDRNLAGVNCTAASRCWAVGAYVKKTALNEILRWNGTTWSRVAAPNPSGTKNPQGLNGITCTGAANCWAVGDHERRSTDLNEALHWNGSRWSDVPTPNPSGRGPQSNNELNAVACSSRIRCWAAGSIVIKGHQRNEILRWNGTKWSQVSVPDPGSASDVLNGVACIGRRACWAVGDYGGSKPGSSNLILRWNGSKWSKVSAPDPGHRSQRQLNSVTCISPARCWAVGQYGIGTGAILNEAMRWNGSKWVLVATPHPGGRPTNRSTSTQLFGVTCARPGDCWAVGQYYDIKAGAGLNEALRWNGTRWSQVATPNVRDHPSNDLSAVSCARRTDCWAVGYTVKTTNHLLLNQAMRWNGSRWSLDAGR